MPGAEIIQNFSPHRRASACRAPAGAPAERGPGHGLRRGAPHVADGKGQSHPLPEGAAGQLPGDVPPQRRPREGTATAQSQGSGEQGRDFEKGSSSAEE